LEKNGYLDFRTGSKRYFVGDPRYLASRNRSPGMAGPLTAEVLRSPALVAAGPGGKGMAVCLREGGLPLEIHRRTGPDWPDEPIAKGKMSIGFDVLRTARSAIGLTTSWGRANPWKLPAAGEKNVQWRVDGEGAVSVWNGHAWQAAGAPWETDRWTAIRLDVDYEATTLAVAAGAQRGVAVKFDPQKLAIDSLVFACLKGEVLVDNIEVRWSW
jgi:hypothetical protein